MGALIQTKGTQRLAKWFNNRFDDTATGLTAAGNVVSASCTLPAAFADSALNLLAISDRFIAQNAVSGNGPQMATIFCTLPPPLPLPPLREGLPPTR